MRCMADFTIDSDLCLDEETKTLTLTAPDKSYELAISNTPDSDNSPVAVLSAQLIFDSPSFEGVRERALGKISQVLNCLVYTTSRQFSLNRIIKIVDWTPGLEMRDAIVYAEALEWDKAEPFLDESFLRTAECLLAMHSGEIQHNAMRWYRLGIETTNVEQQFSYFWFALEIVSATLKDKNKVPSKCPRCQAALFCEKCGPHPEHRRYPAEAVQHLIERIAPRGAPEISQVLQKIRHTLMHGKTIKSIAEDLPCTQEQAINMLAKITHNAIWLLFDKSNSSDDELAFGFVENVTRRTIIGGIHVQTGMLPGDRNNPHVSEFPNIEVSIDSVARG